MAFSTFMFFVTDAAFPFSIGPIISVCLIIGMTLWAMGLLAIPISPASDIRAASYRFKMSRINAQGLTAKMIQLQSVRDRAFQKLVDNDVDSSILPLPGNLTISISTWFLAFMIPGSSSAGPKPATGACIQGNPFKDTRWDYRHGCLWEHDFNRK